MRAWPDFAQAQPNRAHHALAKLQRRQLIGPIITQNVDGLHTRAGSPSVIELHGALERVRCLDCGAISHRNSMQERLEELNPDHTRVVGQRQPDGDVDVPQSSYEAFHVPDCLVCGGTLKPDVVMFGENVPAEVTTACEHAVHECDALLCIGTSLMVYSSFRFARLAANTQKKVIAINIGATRADDLLDLKISESCADVLSALEAAL